MKRKIVISGSSVLGVFASCTDELAFVPYNISDETVKDIEKSLDVKTVSLSIDGSSILGTLMCGNTKGMVIAGFVLDKELDIIKKYTNAIRLTDELNAAGNLILVNDNAALVHPDISDKSLKMIEKTLCVDVKIGTIAGLKTVGMAGVATNKGIIVHPKATQNEIGVIEDLFSLPVNIGTVNFGSPLVGSGILANSKGYIVGKETTSPEISRIEDALGFI